MSRKARLILKNDTCECGNKDHGCEECTCDECGQFLLRLEDRTCDECIEKEMCNETENC